MEAILTKKRENRRGRHVHMRQVPVNLLIGPPADRAQDEAMLKTFFDLQGKHAVCGGTTATLAARHLQKPLEVPSLDMPDPDVPPMGRIEGVDLVTEGMLTLRKVLAYAQAFVCSEGMDRPWQGKRDGASAIARLLLEEATEVRLVTGSARNPGHEALDARLSLEEKLRTIDSLAEALTRSGKRVSHAAF